ncbi:MAG: type III PLP-dependent enzyme [Gemmobacter sp.]
MGLTKTIWATPCEYLAHMQPGHPVLFFAPAALQARARRFLDGFPGLVTYAVKANAGESVIGNLSAAGVRGFDVASPAEVGLVRGIAPGAALHYNNPVRARAEIAAAADMGIQSWSVDSESELAKLIAMVPADGTEIAVRFKLPVAGAAYDFGAKFGATAERAAGLLAQAARAGYIPALTFHPGTQCSDPAAWETYIAAAAGIARTAGVEIARLNVGGGFPSHRLTRAEPALEAIFDGIGRATAAAFGSARPALVCEPGRALVADAFTLAARVRGLRDGDVFLNDGVYGALAELPLIGPIDRIEVISPEGGRRRGAPVARTVFGPTCDSVDRLPGEVALPADLAEEDHVLFHGLGAYSAATNTRFNGFGDLGIETVLDLHG